MDWSKSYEQLMLLEGRRPYACHDGRCNHVARGTWGMVLHHYLGAHHMNHRRRRKP